MESEHLTETTDPLNDVANTLWFEPPIRGQPEQQYLIYFITGNPGLISLYAIFMNTLSGLLNQSSTSPIHVCGSSLPGFGTAGLDSEVESKIPAGLEEQITNTEQLIHKTVKHHEELMPYATGYVPPKVILMGHSIGCYILLEILRRQRAGPGRLEGVEIAGGIMLFPAIVDIGKSWNGRIFRVSSAPFRIRNGRMD
jgi:pimeloyl-ACP methyl ester carboxylesterase